MWRAAVVGILLLALAAVVGLVVERRAVAERWLLAELRSRGGVEEPSLRVSRLDTSGVELRDVSAGPAEAERVVLTWTPRTLLRGRAVELRVVGLRVGLELDGGGSAAPAGGLPRAAPGTLPVDRIRAEDVRIDVGYPAGRASLDGSFSLEGETAHFTGRLTTSTAAVRLPDLLLEARGERSGAELTFELTATDAPGCLALRAEGRHDPGTGVGHALVYLDAAQLGSGRLDPVELVPALGAWVVAASGRLEGHGRIGWGPDAPRQSVDLALRDLDLELAAARFEDINTSLHLEGPPWPPPLPRGQLLSMASFDFGLALENGLVSYGILENGAVELTRAEWDFAGGHVRTAGALDLRADVQALTLVIEDVDLAELLARVDLSGLEGEGRVSGYLPLFRRKGKLGIRAGRLATDATGWVRYRPASEVGAISGQQAGFGEALRALRDFRYESLEMSLDGDPQGVMRVGLRLQGRNPDYYGGHPVDFNVDLEAPLFAAFESARAGYEMPEAIARRLVGVTEPLRPTPPLDCKPGGG
jgi:hypothetical protein